MDRRHATGREHRATKRKRERKNRVLPFDHLQRDPQISQEWHLRIVERLRLMQLWEEKKPGRGPSLCQICRQSYFTPDPATINLLSTLKTLGTDLACTSATCLSIWLSTTP